MLRLAFIALVLSLALKPFPVRADRPVAVSDAYSVDEDHTLNVATPGVLGNDEDPDQDALSAILVGDVSHGALMLNSDGSFTYTPDEHYDSTDSFTYLASDGTADSDEAIVVITINPVNDAPTLAPLPNRSLNEDTSLDNAIDLWAYASDVETADSGLTFTIDNSPDANARVSIDGNRYVDIQPAENWYGSTDVRIKVTDSGNLPAIATFQVTVHSVNDAPTLASLPNRSLDEDTSLDNAIDLWAYASDVETADSDLMFTIDNSPDANAGVGIDGNRYVDIQPAANWYGSTNVRIKATDSGNLSAIATFQVTVHSVNDAPTLAPLPNRSLDEDTSLDNAIDLWAYASDVETADSDLTFTIDNSPDANARVSIDGNRYVDIQPAANWYGSTSVRIKVTDPDGAWDTDTFDVAVNPVNDDPLTVDDSFTVEEDSGPNSLDVLKNDNDFPDGGETLTISGVTGSSPGLGMVSITGDHKGLSYTPYKDRYGPDTFEYTITDGHSGVATATVTVTVQGVNDSPIAIDDVAWTQEDVPVVINVLVNDYDIESEPEGGGLDPSSVVVVNIPRDGTAVENLVTGQITYTPVENWNGSDSFTYRVCDYGAPGEPKCSNLATVSVTAEPVNDPPIADAGPDQSVFTKALVTLDGSGSYDPDGDQGLSYLWIQTGGLSVALSDPTAGTPTFTARGDPDQLTFELTVIDSERQACAAPDGVVIIVNNQPPVADAGPDQEVETGTLVSLDGSESYDPDDDYPLSYIWSQIGEGPRVTLSDHTAETPTFRAPMSPTLLTFRLFVFDSRELPAQTWDEVQIDVGNQPPRADAGEDGSVFTHDPVTLDGSGSRDNDEDYPLTYLWKQTGGITVTLSHPTAVTTTFTAPGDPAALTFALFVTDSLGLPADPISDEVTITVNNRPPVADAGPDRQVGVKTLVTLDGSGSYDPDGDEPLTYHWRQIGGEPHVALSNPYTATMTFTATDDPATLTFALVVTDSFGLPDFTPDEMVITVRRLYAYVPVVAYTVPDLVVQSIQATEDAVRVVIVNQGSAPVRDPFWVFGYINPKTPPSAVNDVWWELGAKGIAWWIPRAALAGLAPGGSLSLSRGDSYYYADLESKDVWPLPCDTKVYVQVDAYKSGTDHGYVLEIDEILGPDYYNNIMGPVASTCTLSTETLLSFEREDFRPRDVPARP